MALPIHGASRITSAINVTPMVDVMLVLLIIFMVITPMLGPGIPVTLARSSNPIDMSDAGKPDALIVAVMHDGRTFLGSQSVAGDALTQSVKERLSMRANKTVYVRADARVRYGSLVDVVDHVRYAGADQLGLLTERRERGAPAPE
jgi:biopolymer transport protein TolR